MPKQNIRSWNNTPEENFILSRLIKKNASNDECISQIKHTKKQCFERWNNHSNPNLKQGPLNDLEKSIIDNEQKINGNEWVKIGKMLNRSPNTIKNYYHINNRKKAHLKLIVIKSNHSKSSEPNGSIQKTTKCFRFVNNEFIYICDKTSKPREIMGGRKYIFKKECNQKNTTINKLLSFEYLAYVASRYYETEFINHD